MTLLCVSVIPEVFQSQNPNAPNGINAPCPMSTKEAAEEAVRQEIPTSNHRASYFKVHKEASVF